MVRTCRYCSHIMPNVHVLLNSQAYHKADYHITLLQFIRLGEKHVTLSLEQQLV